MKLDPELSKVVQGAIADYASGRPYTALGFDLMRSGKDLSMEPVFMLLMNADDWKTISLMMRAIHAADRDVRDKVYRAILSVLEEGSHDE